MKQTIEIEVPDGKKAVWKDGRVFFMDDTSKLPKTWIEYCKKNDIDQKEIFIGGSGLIKNAKAHLALMQLHQLRDCYRQGWKPNYLNGSDKWCIIKCNDKLSVDVHYNRNEFLSFQTKELADQFLNNFKDLIEQAGDLI